MNLIRCFTLKPCVTCCSTAWAADRRCHLAIVMAGLVVSLSLAGCVKREIKEDPWREPPAKKRVDPNLSHHVNVLYMQPITRHG